MKKFVLVVVLVALTTVFAIADTFTLRNSTGYTIYEVYVSHGSSTDWGDDILDPTEVLGPNRTVTINIPDSWRGDPIDILVIDEDGDSYTIYDRRIRNGETVTVTLDDLD